MLRALSNSDIAKLQCVTKILVKDIERYNSEWFGRVGRATAVAVPTSVAEVSELLKYCNNERIGVSTVGGNTGLVGGTLAGSGELLVSLERLNKILDVDTASAKATVESGVILEALQGEIARIGLGTPYDLGARGSCTIGGNIATHAGGINFIKYGPLRGHVVGLEVVLADGTIVDAMSESWKDNSGLDVKQMFIGSEGTLGLITKARLQCVPLPRFKSVAMLHSATPFAESVLRPLELARHHIGESLSAFEFFDAEGAGILPNLPEGISRTESGFTVLVEAAGAGPVEERLDRFLESLDASVDGVVASDNEGMRRLWNYREHLPVVMAKLGPNLKYDVSLPPLHYYELVENVRGQFASQVVKIVGYGHVADGNLHLNVALKPDSPIELSHAISGSVYAFVKAHRGSISAEHGIGRDKLDRLSFSKSHESIEIMTKLKRMMDPNGILNPGRTLPW